MKKEENKIGTEDKKKRNSLFDFLIRKVDDDQFGKQEVSKEKRRIQIIVLVITIIVFVICVVGVGILIWQTKLKISSQSQNSYNDIQYIKNSILLFFNKFN